MSALTTGLEPTTVTVRLMGMPNHRPRTTLLLVAACSTLLAASACSGDEPEPEPASKATARSTEQPSISPGAESPHTRKAGRLDALSISLTLRSTTVQQGRILRSRALIENNTPDPALLTPCAIAEGAICPGANRPTGR